MKQKRFDELAQNGFLISGFLFIILVLLGFLLDNEVILIIGGLMLFYIPALLVAYCIWVARDESRKWKKKRRKAKRQSKRKSKSLVCPTCEKVFNREELDLSPTAAPLCPDCEVKLISSNNLI